MKKLDFTRLLFQTLTKEEVAKWSPSVPVVISAGTGEGKTTWIMFVLYEICKANGQKILILVHRNMLLDQLVADILKYRLDDVISIKSYQQLEVDVARWHKDEAIDPYDYVICDEFHYFMTDAYTGNTDISLDTVMEADGIKVFISATDEDIRPYIEEEYLVETKYYYLPRHYSEVIHELKFYRDDESVGRIADQQIQNGKKALFFFKSAKRANEFYRKHKAITTFCCSKHRKDKMYENHVNTNDIDWMVRNKKLPKQFLSTTACLDCGFSIEDPEVDCIVVDMEDINTLIQCIGRYRMKNGRQITVYIKMIEQWQIENFRKRDLAKIDKAMYLLEYGQEAYLYKYGDREPNGIYIYDDYRKNNGVGKKHVNRPLLRYTRNQIQRWLYMINLGRNGYCEFVREKLGIEEYTIMERYRIEHYLELHLGEEFNSKKDKDVLVGVFSDIGLRNKRHRPLKTISTINAALKEWSISYKLEDFKTNRKVKGQNGKYKGVRGWRIVKVKN